MLLAAAYRADAITLDRDGDLKLGARTYVNARIGTERTHLSEPQANDGTKLTGNKTPGVRSMATYPYSPAGHLRQNRFFLEVELNHKLDRLWREGFGPLELLNRLPFKVSGLAYNLTFRGEYDGIYDWGPREYSTAEPYKKILQLHLAALRGQTAPNVAEIRRHLRDTASFRARLFQAYGQATVANDLFFRFGRQVLSWGETDAFQLLDHINPLDASFGGFLIPLDERRVPLDMLRSQYRIGQVGPLTEVFLEGFLAIDDAVGFDPAPPVGSPWTPPSFGSGRTEVRTYNIRPSRTFKDARGGGRVVFNAGDATFSLAYLNTYLDLPATQMYTDRPTPLIAFDEGKPCPIDRTRPYLGNDPNKNSCGSPAHAVLTAARTQIFGTTSTFAIPSLYSVFRSEFAYFKDEPAYTQYQLDPFMFTDDIYGAHTTGGRRLRDSINAVVGWDANVRIRALNPDATFLVSTQFFYKRIRDAAGRKIFNPDGTLNPDREVLPVIDYLGLVKGLGIMAEPVYIRQPRDSFLQTLFITTSYMSGKVNPIFAMFYDWGGAFVYQPGVTLIRDPFRFAMNYSILDAHHYKGGSGVSLLRDRDNIEFRIEYVI